MKQKNAFWYFLAVLMVTMLSIGGVSCSNDDDSKGSESSSLRGTSWAYDKGYKSGIITFNSDKNGTWIKQYSDDNETNTISFTYTLLRNNTGTIVTKEKSDSSSSGYSIDNYYFEIVDNILYVYEVDDDDEDDKELKYICYKVSNDKDNSQSGSLSGTSWVNQEGRYTRTLNFKSGGTGTAIYRYQDPYSGTETETISFTYDYNSSKKRGTITIREYDSYKGRYTNMTYEFEIGGNKLYLYDEEDDDEIVFTKQ